MQAVEAKRRSSMRSRNYARRSSLLSIIEKFPVPPILE